MALKPSVHIRLLGFVKPYRRQMLGTILVVAAASTLTMTTPKLLQWAVDSGLKPPAYDEVDASLAQRLDDSTTRVFLTDATGIQPGRGVRIGSEEMRVTAVSGDALTVERGQNATDATAHEVSPNDRVYVAETANAAGRTKTLLIAAGALLVVALLRGVFTYWQTFMAEWLAQHVAFDLRNLIYEKLQRLSYAYHDNQQTGQLMSRATQDVEATRMFIQLGCVRLMDIGARVLTAATLMLITDWRLAAVAWLVMPIVAFRSIQVQLQMRKVWFKVQEQLGRVTTVLQENLTGVRVVKAFSREATEQEKFNAEVEELFDWSYRTNRIQAANTPFYMFCSMLGQVGVLFFGAIWITDRSLTPGELTAFLAYLTLLLLPMRMLGFIVSNLARAGAAGERIFEVLDAESTVQEKTDAIVLSRPQGHVRYEGVSFSYDSISPVLRDVNFEVPAGKVVALLGPTGCGKTTVVNLLPRFYDVTAGRITVDGIDIRDMTLASLRANIGIIQQDVFMFSATIRENIAYGAVHASDEAIVEAAKVARIHDFVVSLPDGYDTWVGERGVTLSGGQKQRLSIARTLLLDPAILVLDDSTSSVDMQTEFLMQQALSAVVKDRTTLVIAQRLRTVRDADEILVMREGRIVERGRHASLIESGGLYREIYDLELRDQEEALSRLAPTAATGGAGG